MQELRFTSWEKLDSHPVNCERMGWQPNSAWTQDLPHKDWSMPDSELRTSFWQVWHVRNFIDVGSTLRFYGFMGWLPNSALMLVMAPMSYIRLDMHSKRLWMQRRCLVLCRRASLASGFCSEAEASVETECPHASYHSERSDQPSHVILLPGEGARQLVGYTGSVQPQNIVI